MDTHAEIYKALQALCPEIMRGQWTFARYGNAGDVMEPLSIDSLGNDQFSIMQWYIQCGDLMRDPDIVVQVDHEHEAAYSLSYQLDSLGLYEEPDIGTTKQQDLDKFLLCWLIEQKELNRPPSCIHVINHGCIMAVHYDHQEQMEVDADALNDENALEETEI